MLCGSVVCKIGVKVAESPCGRRLLPEADCETIGTDPKDFYATTPPGSWRVWTPADSASFMGQKKLLEVQRGFPTIPPPLLLNFHPLPAPPP